MTLRKVEGLVWHRDDVGRYTAMDGNGSVYTLFPVRVGRSGGWSYSLNIDDKSMGGSFPMRGLKRAMERAAEISTSRRSIGGFVAWLQLHDVFLCRSSPGMDLVGEDDIEKLLTLWFS